MTTLQLVGLCLFVVLLGFIVRNIHWPEFVASKQKQHMLFGCAAAVFFGVAGSAASLRGHN